MDAFTLSAYIIATAYSFFLLMCIFFWIKEQEYLPLKNIPSSLVTIIIAARNEEKNILSCLEHLYLQNFPKELFEIIVVDDDSTDTTATIVKHEIKKNNNLRLIELKKESLSGKKKAIEEGIKNSKGDLIITLDADCVMGERWLINMVLFYEQHRPKMIIGPVSLTGGKKFIEKFQAVEYAGLMLITGATAFMKNPLMCSGANLAYEKKAFYEVGGFEGIDSKASGDDVLLLFKMKKKYPQQIKFIKSKEAIVSSQPVNTLHDFINQRIRWSSKTTSSKNIFNIVMAFIVLCYTVFIISSLLFSIVYIKYLHIGLNLLLLKCIIDFLFLFLAVTYFKKNRFIFFFPVFQLFNTVYVIVIGCIAIFIKRYRWKERIVS